MSKKTITFEGREIGVSSTFKKIQAESDKMSSSILRNYAKTAQSSKGLIESLKKEMDSQTRLGQLAAKDKRFEALEKYERKLKSLHNEEDIAFEKLRKRGLSKEDEGKVASRIKQDFDTLRKTASSNKSNEESGITRNLEEQKTTNDLLKELIESNKNKWEQEIIEDRKSVEKNVSKLGKGGFKGLSDEQYAKAKFQEKMLEETAEPKKKSVFSEVMKSQLVRDLGSLVSAIPSASDGYDLVPIASQITGAGIGAAGGSILEATTAGQIEYAVIGSEIGKQVGAVVGNSIMRYINESEKVESGSLRTRAITGDLYKEGSMAKFGVSRAEASQMSGDLYRTSGSSTSVEQILELEKGYGLDRGMLTNNSKFGRMLGNSVNDDYGTSISSLLGGAEFEGIKKVDFEQLIQTQLALTEQFSQSNEKVDMDRAGAIAYDFNKLGGMFSASDPRSTEMISSISNSLSNPQNDFQKAMNFETLREIDPSASLLDMMQMQEEGLGGENGREFLKKTVGKYNDMFGDDKELVILSLKQRFPNIPISQLRKIANGEDVLGSSELAKVGQVSDVTDGSKNVSTRVKMSAEVSDAFAVGAIEGMEKVTEQFGDIIMNATKKGMEKAMDSLKKDISDSTKSSMGIKTNE